MAKKYYFLLFIVITLVTIYYQEVYVIASSFYVLFVLDGLTLLVLILLAELITLLVGYKKIIKCPNCNTRRVFNPKINHYYECDICHKVIDTYEFKNMHTELNQYNTLICAIVLTCLKNQDITPVQEKAMKQYMGKMINEEYNGHSGDLYQVLLETPFELVDLLDELEKHDFNRIQAANLIEFILSLLFYRNCLVLVDYPLFIQLIRYYKMDEKEYIMRINNHNEPVYLHSIAAIFKELYLHSRKEYKMYLKQRINEYLASDIIVKDHVKLVKDKIFSDLEDHPHEFEEITKLNHTVDASYKITLLFNISDIFHDEFKNNPIFKNIYHVIVEKLQLPKITR